MNKTANRWPDIITDVLYATYERNLWIEISLHVLQRRTTLYFFQYGLYFLVPYVL